MKRHKIMKLLAVTCAALPFFCSGAYADIPKKDPPMPEQKPEILVVEPENNPAYDDFKRAILIELATTDPRSKIPQELIQELKSVAP